MMKKIAIVAGATGLVGKNLVNQLVLNNEYKKIIVIARREPKHSDPKIQFIQADFKKIDELKFNEKIDTCFCALGTTQKKMGKKGLYKVDYEYVAKLAEMCETNNISSLYIVSSQGANPDSPFFYMRTKGQMEETVKQKNIASVYIVRPSLITGKREEERWMEQVGYYLYKIMTPFLVGKLRKVRPVSALQIAKALIHLASENKAGKHTIESLYIQQF